MYFEEENYYYKPTLADEIMYEYQEKMKDALLESVKNKLEKAESEYIRIKKENEQLRKQSRDVENKRRELEQKEKDLERNFYRKKFSELIKPFEEKYSGYYADKEYKMVEKCNQCDSERKVNYTAPNGETKYLDCSCKKSYMVYLPVSTSINI